MGKHRSAPALTEDLAYRLEQAYVDFTRERLDGMRRLPGNPAGVEIRGDGDAVASRVESNAGVDWMNMVMGLRPVHADRIAELVEPYLRDARNCWVETVPGVLTPELSGWLCKSGFTPLRFHTVLYGVAREEVPAPARDVDLRVAAPEEIELFLDLFLAGFEFPEAAWEGAKVNMRHWGEREDWTLYIGSLRGRPAAAGVLYAARGVGYMAAAGTVPEMRGAGLQTALLQRRIRDAAMAGCELITGQAHWGTISLRNQQRAGMEVAYTKLVWYRPGAG